MLCHGSSEEKLYASPPLPRTSYLSAATFGKGATETDRILLVLYMSYTRRSSTAEHRMLMGRLASLFSLGPGACFHCQGGEPGKELDLAKGLGEYGKGVGGLGMS